MGQATRKKWHGCFRRTELDSVTNESKLITASIVLGLRSEMSKSQAREKLEDELTKLGGRSSGDQIVAHGAVTFEWFVTNRYLPRSLCPRTEFHDGAQERKEGEEKKKEVPTRGKLLQFAGKMRAKGLGGDPLNT
jgi:hypothetical protein